MKFRTLFALASALSSACSLPAQVLDTPVGQAPETSRVIGEDGDRNFDLGSKVYVSALVAEERAEPAPDARVLNLIYRRQTLPVVEVLGDWVRVTEDGFLPRWVHADSLSADRPIPSPLVEVPVSYRDPRIAPSAIPERAGNGLTEKDVILLWRGAKRMLDTRRCRKVDYADKSTSREGLYFVQDGNNNVYFSERDLM